MLRPEQIINAKFTPVSKGTYNAEEVDAFLKSVAASYEESLSNNQELIKKISILADKIESYRNEEDAIKLALLDAHKMAETVNKNAAQKAEALVSDAESKSKIILDGANRQASQTIEEAREKAKEIVDNARTAVSSLTERAQIETDSTIAEAKKKASEIIADAEEKGRKIIGTSKQSYEFYSAELEKVQEKTAEFKAAVEEICKGQLDLLGGIPGVFAAASEVTTPVEEVAEEVVYEAPAFVEADEKEVDIAFDEIIEEINSTEEEEPVAEEEYDPSAVALMAEINSLADDVLNPADDASVEFVEEEDDEIAAVEETSADIVEEKTEEVLEVVDDDDDLFSLIDDMDFEEIPEVDSIPASLDDIVPFAPVIATEDEVESEEEAEDIQVVIDDDDDDDDEFTGFQVDIDSIAEDDGDDEDITSLFDSLFDD